MINASNNTNPSKSPNSSSSNSGNNSSVPPPTISQPKSSSNDSQSNSQSNNSQDMSTSTNTLDSSQIKVQLPAITTVLSNPTCIHVTDSANQTKQPTKPRKRTKCVKCGKRGHQFCQKCKDCCLKDGGCTEHDNSFKIKSLENYEIVILDSETTDFKVRSMTDFYARNISTGTTLEFPKFIKPRTKIQKEVTKITNITNEMVLAGRKECDAVKEIIEYLPKKTIVIAHNAPFDRDVLFKSYMYHKQKSPHCNR